MDKLDERAFELLFEIHKDLPREGPGNQESTARAFSMLTALPENPLILDIGCGPGKQTIDLAQLTDGKIVAVDTHKPYLDVLMERAGEQGLDDRIVAEHGDMFDLGYDEGSFDLIWAEGSIFIIGFQRGLVSWKHLLKERGYLAATELTWLKPDPPTEVVEYWNEEYPPMTTNEENLKVIRESGYEVVGHFALPESAWWDDYYSPEEKRIVFLREKYKDDEEAMAHIEYHQKEIDVYRRFSDYYGYVFYVCRAL